MSVEPTKKDVNEQINVPIQTHKLAPRKNASLTAWIDYLLAIHPSEIDMGLARVSWVAEKMGLLDFSQTQVITVAGTNGKGSTCALIEAALTLEGLSVGVYSSPHLLHYNERVRVNGEDAKDSDLVAAFEAIELGRGETSLTFFEYATLTGLYLFKAAQLDVILLEVGLGGRLDATNVVDADVAVITSIDLDHQEYLGDTREQVAVEKAGICRKGKPVIIGEPDRPSTLIETVNAVGAQMCAVGPHFSYQITQTHWTFQGQLFHLSDLPLPQLPLPNAATAIAALEHICPSISLEHIKQAISQTRLSGRLECVSEAPTILLDVAHNPHAARYLLSRLLAKNPTRLLALCGMLKDKEIAQVLALFTPHIARWYCCDLAVPRGARGADLAACLPQGETVQVFESLALGWAQLQEELQEDDIVIVFGSFYTVAGIKTLIKGNDSV
ncbi:bifunctional tetrahydrofolate synthase/dihydrofolate synthase [uncultured Shewanella sp.]|uniref:bifunctional tetrahydrofolate synthase/dihydrofolate synthase n=1 Tax=uncultured Shewanella sp. TaxID=173975 RepID=UPI00260BDFF3|nr:bifunctional tetrahydrofolate synthase/dihydrofolate synthase [uncultured Shewanella sp.]